MIRVLPGAPEVVALLVVTWLVSELIGAVAVRLAIVRRPDRRSDRSAGALGWIVRHPLRSLGSLVATVIGSVIVARPR